MKHFITFVFILLSYLSYGQITGTQVLSFEGNVTTAVRDALDVPAGKYYLIYNTDDSELQVAGSDDVWTPLLAGGTDDQTAAEVAFTPYSTIAATNVQAAIQEALDEAVGTDDQTASEVPITDAGGIITATDVEGALQENRTAIDLNTAKVSSVFSGSIADTQVAFGTGADAIGGDADLTYNSTTNLLTAGGYFTAGSLEGRRTILNTAGASADEWVILISNEESPEVLFQLWDGGYGVGPVIENYSLHVGTPVDAADLIDLGFLQAGLDDLAGVLDASAFSGNLATTDDTLQELADAVDGLVLGGGGLANVVEDTTPELGGNLDAMNFAVSNLLEAEWVYTTGANVVYTGFSAGNDSFRLAAPNDASQSLRYTFSTGLWFYPYDNSTSGLTANNLQSAIDELEAGAGAINLGNANLTTTASRIFKLNGEIGLTITNDVDATIAEFHTETGINFPGTFVAPNLGYDNSTSGLTATTVKNAIDELASGAGTISDTGFGGSWDGVTAVGASKNAIYDEMIKKLQSVTAGEPSGFAAISNIGSIDYDDYEAGTPVAGTHYIVTGAPPAQTFTGTVIPLDGYYTADNTATDTATWTLNATVKNGAAFDILINQASEPAITGATQIPGTASFETATLSVIKGTVIQGTVYYYFLALE